MVTSWVFVLAFSMEKDNSAPIIGGVSEIIKLFPHDNSLDSYF